MFETIKQHGSYKVVQYDTMVTIDFSNKSIGMTAKVFDTVEQAIEMFDKVIAVLPESKVKRYNKKLILALGGNV